MVLGTQVALVVKNPPANARDIRDAILSSIIVCWRGGGGGGVGGGWTDLLSL